jgi:formate dehydrogenase maturation protein FdhE
MFKFFCSICADDKDLYAERLDMGYAYATCPDCDTILKETYARHDDITEEEMTTESYLNNNGLDNNTP